MDYSVAPALLIVELAIGEGFSLKDKRHIIKSMLAQAQNKFGVSAAEVGEHDSIRKAVLAFSFVSNDGRFTGQVLDRVLQFVESDPRVYVQRSEVEML